ncbi:MAG: ABC transporter permease [Acidimicrobiales bacterium]
MTDVLTPASVTAATEQRVRSPRRPRRRGRLVVPYLVTVWFLVTLNFLIPRAMPGNPISALEDPSAPTYVRDDSARAALAHHYALDRPLASQYLHYVGGLLHGDLGESIRYNAPVADLVAERLPWTLLLVGTAMAVASAAGLFAGVQSAWRRGTSSDRWLLGLFLGMRNFPVFFLGSLALFVFAVKLRWLPLGGASTPFVSFGILARLADVGRHLVLPAAVLAVQFAAGHFLLMRASMVSELGADYLLAGRVKGLRERRLKYGYAARNALLPVVTLMALEVGFAITGSIFIETVFAYPGMGRLVFDSVAFRDYPVLQACFLVLTLVVVTLNLAVDLLYARLDPRVAA